MKELDFSDQIIGKRSGPKSGAQTPAKPSEKKKAHQKISQEALVKVGQVLHFPQKLLRLLKIK
ncbi:MAG: hypothetical protein CBC05_08935 [Crocinitomicaceae bacterium TMED45]|nr:MAG: hypothetical protein CBC05_08935 [Crocinitomicaceae bacterium TMED45]